MVRQHNILNYASFFLDTIGMTWRCTWCM